MSKRLVILGASVVANVLLAALLVRESSTTTVEPTAVAEGATVSGKVASRKATSAEAASESPAAAGLSGPQDAALPFNWSQLESQDYKDYIERLRAFGVPEKIIRDIVIADVQRMYRPRFAALRPPKKAANPNFWENRNNWFGPYGNMTREQREQMNALNKEQTELIKTLLGKNVYLDMAKDAGQPDWTERQFGSLGEEQRDKVGEIQQRFQEASSEIYAKADGFIDQDTQADLKTLRRKMREELATVLTPEQIEDYEMRSSDTANNMRWQLGPFEPNEKEYRAIFKYKQLQEDLNSSRNLDDEGKPPSAEERKAQQQKLKDLEDALAQTLDPDRLKEYKLLDDWTYRNLVEAGVPKESVFKLADMKKQAEDAARKIRQDKSLSPEQRNEALKAVRTETEQSLTELIGTRRAKAYASNGGWWLRNIAPRE